MIEDQSDATRRPANRSLPRRSSKQEEQGVASTTTTTTGDASTPQTRRSWAETAVQWVFTAIGGLICAAFASLFKMPSKMKPRPQTLAPLSRGVLRQIHRNHEEEEKKRREAYKTFR